MSTPQLTPAKLFNGKKLPPEWAEAKAAFICYTPFPSWFSRYVMETAPERYFLHSPMAEVKLCSYAGIPFIVISEVYGFEVGSTTVEELLYYGINDIIGIGYVGAFNGAPIGQKFIAASALSDLPLAKHYGVDEFTETNPTNELYKILKSLEDVSWEEYTVWCTNSLYREYPELVKEMKEEGCAVVNMDTISIYAVAPICAEESGEKVRFIYVGTVTDSETEDGENWNSDLIETINSNDKQPHDELVELMVESFLPKLYLAEK